MSKIYMAEVLEECANGDAILQIPNELMEDCDWRVNDVIDLNVEDGVLVMRNLSKEQREEKNE